MQQFFATHSCYNSSDFDLHTCLYDIHMGNISRIHDLLAYSDKSMASLAASSDDPNLIYSDLSLKIFNVSTKKWTATSKARNLKSYFNKILYFSKLDSLDSLERHSNTLPSSDIIDDVLIYEHLDFTDNIVNTDDIQLERLHIICDILTPKEREVVLCVHALPYNRSKKEVARILKKSESTVSLQYNSAMKRFRKIYPNMRSIDSKLRQASGYTC